MTDSENHSNGLFDLFQHASDNNLDSFEHDQVTTNDVAQHIEDHAKRNDAAIPDEADRLVCTLEEYFRPKEKPFSMPIFWAGFVYYGL